MAHSFKKTLMCAALLAATTITANAQEASLNTAFQYLTVPEVRDDAESRDIQIAYLKLDGAAQGTPTFVFFGGPGGSATDYGTLESLRASHNHLLDGGDVVFIEQRGVGASPDALDCNTLHFPLDAPVTRASLIDGHANALASCATDADLRGYTTTEIADDAEAIRVSLGYEQINLSGGSYGAQQAYFYIHRHGEHVNRAVLSQFLVPQGSLAMPSMIDSYINQVGDRVGPAYGFPQGGGTALSGLMQNVFAYAEQTPIEIQLGDATLVAGRTDLEIVTSLALRRTRETWLLPMLYSQMSQGEFGFVGQAMMQFYRGGLPVNAAVIAFDCAAQALPERQGQFDAEADVALTGRGAHLPFPDVCNSIEHGRINMADYALADLSDIPVLFIQGELDARARDEALVETVEANEAVHMLVIGNATHDLGRSASEEIGGQIDVIEARFLFDDEVPEARIDVPLALN